MKKYQAYLLVLVIATLAVMAASFLFSVQVYEQLPSRIAVHFNFSGQPDRWAERSMGVWLALPIVAAAIGVLFCCLSLLLPLLARFPGMVNMPPKWKQKFVGLSPEDKKTVLRLPGIMLAWTGLVINAWFLFLQWSSYRFAIGQYDSLAIGLPSLGIIALMLASVIALMLAMKKAINRL